MIDNRIIQVSEDGGSYNKRYLKAELDINYNLWFLVTIFY